MLLLPHPALLHLPQLQPHSKDVGKREMGGGGTTQVTFIQTPGVDHEHAGGTNSTPAGRKRRLRRGPPVQ